MRLLGAREHQRAVLTESYRCPPEVEAYARALVGRGSQEPRGRGTEEPRGRGTEEPRGRGTEEPRGRGAATSALVEWRASDPCARVRRLIEALAHLEAADPTATIGVICRTAIAARAMAHALGRVRPVRLALDGDFDFLPGTVVTTVAEAKGLEMDTVVVPDREAYGDDPESRRALYVAATRASHQLLVAGPGLDVQGTLA